MASNKLRLCTWNIKGVHSPVKRRKVLRFLKKGHIDIALLQETHLDDEEHLKLQKEGFNQVFFSSFTSRSRGVAILVRRNLQFSLLDCIKEKKWPICYCKGHLARYSYIYTEHVLPSCSPL